MLASLQNSDLNPATSLFPNPNNEPPTLIVTSASQTSIPLRDYLKRYTNNDDNEELMKKKRKMISDVRNTINSIDSDLSPPRRRREGSPLLAPSLPKTGLISARDLKEEIQRTKTEELKRFRAMDPSVSGRDAKAVYRNKMTGKCISEEEFLTVQKEKKQQKPKEVDLVWGKGLAQKHKAESRRQEIETLKDKPFATSKDAAAAHEKWLREKPRFDDPMAHLIKKRNPESVIPDLGDSEKLRECGFIIPQEIPSHSWVKRGVVAPTNRYEGIKPGRHWDGVDRSNGYENELMMRRNEGKAIGKEAYKWSVSDM